MITLYSTGCPKCKILEQKLDNANIEYNICNDINKMEEKGFMSLPMLEVNDEIMGFGEAVKWINNKGA